MLLLLSLLHVRKAKKYNIRYKQQQLKPMRKTDYITRARTKRRL